MFKKWGWVGWIVFLSISMGYAEHPVLAFSQCQDVFQYNPDLDIEMDLYNGKVIHSQPFTKNGNRSEVYWVYIQNPKTGRMREALFKPRPYGDREGWNRTPMEYVGYELNLLLGMNYVPPVAYRRNMDVHFRHYSEGAMIQFVEDLEILQKIPESRWGIRKDLFLSDMRILDVLLQNTDRISNNIAYGRNWATENFQPILIDFGAGLRKEALVLMTDENAFQTGAVKVIRKKTLDYLKKLSFARLKSRIGEFVADQEIHEILDRRDGILRYFDALILRYGASNLNSGVIIPE